MSKYQRCIVKGCRDAQKRELHTSNYSILSVCKTKERLLQWKSILKIERPLKFWDVICSIHFEESDFYYGDLLQIKMGQRRKAPRLLPHAIPHVYLYEGTDTSHKKCENNEPTNITDISMTMQHVKQELQDSDTDTSMQHVLQESQDPDMNISVAMQSVRQELEDTSTNISIPIKSVKQELQDSDTNISIPMESVIQDLQDTKTNIYMTMQSLTKELQNTDTDISTALHPVIKELEDTDTSVKMQPVIQGTDMDISIAMQPIIQDSDIPIHTRKIPRILRRNKKLNDINAKSSGDSLPVRRISSKSTSAPRIRKKRKDNSKSRENYPSSLEPSLAPSNIFDSVTLIYNNPNTSSNESESNPLIDLPTQINNQDSRKCSETDLLNDLSSKCVSNEQNKEPDENSVYIVNMSSLKVLFKFCFSCGAKVLERKYEKTYKIDHGTILTVETKCVKGCKKMWTSQPQYQCQSFENVTVKC